MLAAAPFLWFLSQNQPKESSPTGRFPFHSPLHPATTSLSWSSTHYPPTPICLPSLHRPGNTSPHFSFNPHPIFPLFPFIFNLQHNNPISLHNSQHSLYPLLSQPACSSSSPIEVSRRCTFISHIGQAPLLQSFLQRPQTQQHRSSLLGNIFFFDLLNIKRPKQQPEASPTTTPPSRSFSLGAAYHPKRRRRKRKPKKDMR